MPKVHISIRIDAEKLRYIEKLAKREGKTVSAFIRDVLEEHIKGKENSFLEVIPIFMEIYDKMLENLLDAGKLPLEEATTLIQNYLMWKYGKSPSELSFEDLLAELRNLLTYFCKLERWSIKKYGPRIILHIRTASSEQTVWVSNIIKLFLEKFSDYVVKICGINKRDAILLLCSRFSEARDSSPN